MNQKKPTVFITMGDMNGIATEVILKSLHQLGSQCEVNFIIIGNKTALDFYQERIGIHLDLIENKSREPDSIHFIHVDVEGISKPEPGKMSPAAGRASIRFIEEALMQMKNHTVSAVVTGPVCKEAIWRSGLSFRGQTEFFAESLKAGRYAMMLISGNLRVGLVTTHHSIRDVPALLNSDLIVDKALVVDESLRQRFGIASPRLAVTALNPHNGENGLLGEEEKQIIRPAVEQLRNLDIQVEGPFPADTLFASWNERTYDAYLAMYHDQGMIPVKIVGFGEAVNFTAGLPIIRTSPDHGTAFDIAGRGTANASSMKEAIKIAIKFAKKESDSGKTI